MALTVTTWNIQNFERGAQVYEEKLEYLASTLRVLNADVVALQEVLDSAALEDLAQALSFTPIATTPGSRGIRVAFLVRPSLLRQSQEIDQWSLPEGTQVREFDQDGAIQVRPMLPRPALQITIAQAGSTVQIITAHLKSKLLSFGNDFATSDERLRAHTAYFALERRAAEAVSLREHVSQRLRDGQHVILLGDLNDGSEAATTQILYGPPSGQIRTPDDVLDPHGSFQRQDRGDKQRLFNITKIVPEALRWSRRHNGQKELLDHILVSQGLLPRVGGVRQVPAVSILNGETPNLVGTNPTISGVIPDHAPVTATFC